MASWKLDFKAAPTFDIENERHLFDQWNLMWESYEVLSGISNIKDATEKQATRMHAL